MSSLEQLKEGAREWLEAAKDNHTAGHKYVAFESYRHAAELAAKALILERTGSFPRDHAVAGPLASIGLVPAGVTARALQKLLSEFTLGTYGFERAVLESDLQSARRIAQRMVEAL